MKEEITFLTDDHPEANGRKPQSGEVEYIMRFPLEDGRELVIRAGQKTFDVHTDLMIDMLSRRPSHSDGSTNA